MARVLLPHARAYESPRSPRVRLEGVDQRLSFVRGALPVKASTHERPMIEVDGARPDNTCRLCLKAPLAEGTQHRAARPAAPARGAVAQARVMTSSSDPERSYGSARLGTRFVSCATSSKHTLRALRETHN